MQSINQQPITRNLMKFIFSVKAKTRTYSEFVESFKNCKCTTNRTPKGSSNVFPAYAWETLSEDTFPNLINPDPSDSKDVVSHFEPLVQDTIHCRVDVRALKVAYAAENDD